MKSAFQDLQTFIVDELFAAYRKREMETLLFHSLLNKVAETYNLTILQNDAGYEIRGEKGYNIITDMLYILKRMNDMGIILYHTQGKPSTTIDDMNYSNPELHSSGLKITEDFAEYLKECLGKSIWVSPEIEHFAENGFVSEELAIARQQMQEAQKQAKEALLQTRYAGWTLAISILTLLVSICSPIITKIISNCCHCL